jgi:protein-S-isoprenylcysteine O-methyltransferase Ste14
MLRRPLPPTYFLGSICLILALSFLFPIAQVLHWPWRLSGVIAIAVGAWLNLAADSAFKAHDTTVKPFERSRTLATDGVFRFTRNPMYLGMVLILTGVTLLLGTLSPFLVCAVFAALLHFRFVLVEERMLAETFGPQWKAYRDRTRRWI